VQQTAADHEIEALNREQFPYIAGHEPRIWIRLACRLDVRRREIAARPVAR
jgi:hypothetical protein